MKITYSKGYIPTPTLRSLEQGEVFRPENSLKVYMKTAYTGFDDIFSDTAYEDYAENIQNLDFDTARDLRACVDLSNGEIVFFHSDIKVRVLECELNIVESEE